MKPIAKSISLIGATFVFAFSVGGFLGSRLTGRIDAEMMHSMILSDAALKTIECTVLLQAMRDGSQDCAIKRVESRLDFALINLGREYSASRDLYQGASSALMRAREYRAVYPRKSSLASVDQQVASALTIKTTVALQKHSER